jgi:hypothetical protein
VTVPAAGVMTGWTSKSEIDETRAERLKVLRAGPTASYFTVIGESAEQLVVNGINSYSTRIPVRAGDRIGLYGPQGVLICVASTPADSLGVFYGDVPLGSSEVFSKENGRVAVLAEIEPDLDGDGFGDETQDRCPQSAAVQAPCPPLTLDAAAKAPGRGSVLILVATSTEAPVTVSGTVKLPGGSKKARSSAKAMLNAPKETVTAGAIAGFKLKFTKALRTELAGMPKGRSLKLKVKVEGRNLAGVVSTDSLTVKLKGQG